MVVTAPERLAIEETKDLVSELTSFGITVRHLMVNKVFPDLDSDFSRTRRVQEQRLLEEMRNTFPKQENTHIPLQAVEPRGIENLHRFATTLYK